MRLLCSVVSWEATLTHTFFLNMNRHSHPILRINGPPAAGGHYHLDHYAPAVCPRNWHPHQRVSIASHVINTTIVLSTHPAWDWEAP
ncbi:hypothetical protein E4T56_gene9674, partial [Termitomyces sp. T112]